MRHIVLLGAACAAFLFAGTPATAQKLLKEAEAHAKTLRTDKDPDRRAQAARDLAGIATLKADYVRPHTAILLVILQFDPDTAVRVAAGTTLLAFDPDSKEVVGPVLAVLKNDKEPGAVLAVAAKLAATHKAKEAIPSLQMHKQREEAKDDPKLRDQRLLQAVNQALQALSK